MFSKRTRKRKATKRNFARTHHRVVRHKQDFEWQPRKNNPHRNSGANKGSFRKRAVVVCCVACFCGVAGLFLYHPFFTVKEISVSGATRTSPEEIQETASAVLAGRRFFIIPASNIFFVHKDEIADILMNKYDLQSVDVVVSMPGEVSLRIVEKITSVIYDDGVSYQLIGNDGTVIEPIRTVSEREWKREVEVTTTTLADGTVHQEEREISRTHVPAASEFTETYPGIPVVYDLASSTVGESGVVVDPNRIAAILSWERFLSEPMTLEARYFEIVDGFGSGVVHTNEGWQIRTDFLEESVNEQQAYLKEVLPQLPRPNLQYVDLRFENRVHWK